MQKDHNDIKELDIYFPISEYDELLGVSINGDSVVFTEIRWVHLKSSLNGSYVVRKHLYEYIYSTRSKEIRLSHHELLN